MERLHSIKMSQENHPQINKKNPKSPASVSVSAKQVLQNLMIFSAERNAEWQLSGARHSLVAQNAAKRRRNEYKSVFKSAAWNGTLTKRAANKN